MTLDEAVSFNQIPLKKNMDLVTKYHIKSANKVIYYLVLMALAVLFVLSISSLGLSVHNYQDDSGLTLPGGGDTQVQFNDSGSFDGDPGLVYNQINQRLTVNRLVAGGNSYPTTTGFNNEVLTTDGTGNLFFSSKNSTGAAGNDTEVQFNTGGNFDASPDLTFNTGTGVLQTENLTVNDLLIVGPNTYPTVTGTNGQVLTTDGIGNLTFQDGTGSVRIINDLLDASAPPAHGFENSIMLGQAVTTAIGASFNTAVGLSAMTSITTGTSNVVIGFNAGNGITTGTSNVVIGSYSGTQITNQNNLIVIGSGAEPNGTQNEITLGNSSIDTIRCGETTLTTLSDGRDKINVEDTQFGLDFLMKLRPVDYTWQRRILEPGDVNHHKNGKRRSGFIAQELLDAVGEEGNQVLDLVYQTNPERLEVKYGNLIPSLVKSIQQLENKVKILEEKLNYA